MAASVRAARALKKKWRTGRIKNKRIIIEGPRLVDILYELGYPPKICILVNRVVETKRFRGRVLPHDMIVERHEHMEELIQVWDEMDLP